MSNATPKFIIDANVLITPARSFYPFDFAKIFWEQLAVHIGNGNIAIPDVVYDEIIKGNDEVPVWLKSIEIANKIDRRENAIIENYSSIITYLNDSPLYSSKAVHQWSQDSVADPWIIAMAMVTNSKVVTFEKRKESLSEKQPTSSPKINNVCEEFGVSCIELYQMMRELKMGF